MFVFYLYWHYYITYELMLYPLLTIKCKLVKKIHEKYLELIVLSLLIICLLDNVLILNNTQ